MSRQSRTPHEQGQEGSSLPSASEKNKKTALPDELIEGDELLELIHWRLLKKNTRNLSALTAQLGYPRPDLVRRTFDTGDQVESALALPDETTGLHATYKAERLAAELLPKVNALIDFEMAHGQTPTLIRMQAEQIAELREIKNMIQHELRLLLSSELRTILREEIGVLLANQPENAHLHAPATSGHSEPTNPTGLLTSVNPEMEAAVDDMFR